MRWQSISGEVPENISADSPLVFLIRIIGRVPAEMHVPDSFGVSVFLAEQVREDLKAAGYQCSLINARFVKPLDTERIRKISENHRILVTIEENVFTGGFGEQVEDFVMREGIPLKVRTIGISDDYVEHGNVDVLRKEVGLDRESIVKKVIADDRRIEEEK